jgi:hypothetical protein
MARSCAPRDDGGMAALTGGDREISALPAIVFLNSQ